MQIGKLLIYSNIYAKPLPTIESLIRLMPLQPVIELCCFLNGQLHFQTNSKEIQSNWLNEIIDRQPNFEQRRVRDAINDLGEEDLQIFNSHAGLSVISSAIQCYNGRSTNNLSPKEELSLFKAILVANEVFDERSGLNTRPDLPSGSLERLTRLIWPMWVNTHSLKYSKNVFTYAFRMVKNLEYLNNTEEFKIPIQKWLKTQNIDSFKDYVKNLLGIYIAGFDGDKMQMRAYLKFGNEIIYPIIEFWTLDLREEIPSHFNPADLKSFRETPFIRLKDSSFYVSDWNLVVDKFNKGMVFDVFYGTEIKDLVD